MEVRRRYRKKSDRFIIAVQVSLDTEGFTYQKWGAEQRCKPGDWLVDNDGEVYSVSRDTFVKTYRRVSPGIYMKTTPVWAEIAKTSGTVKTEEGHSNYKAGDYLVYNNEDGKEADYCMTGEKFKSMYESDEQT